MIDFPECSTMESNRPGWQASVADLAAVESIARLEEVLSRPSPADVACLRRFDGDIAILGAGGKMGPSLSRRVRRASDAAGGSRRVIAVSISWEPGVQESLSSDGIETRTCDFLDVAALARLPLCPNVLYLVGRKFGTEGHSDLTWAVNTLAPAYMADRFTDSRVVVFSSGNVYGMVPVEGDGSVETDLPVPVGEYAQSCLGRERVAEYFSRARGMRCLLFRLNYAVDLRYGVVMDVGRRVFEGQAIDLRVGHANVIWQGVKKNDSRYVSDSHDYMLIYAKNEAHLTTLRRRPGHEHRTAGRRGSCRAAHPRGWSSLQCNRRLSTRPSIGPAADRRTAHAIRPTGSEQPAGQARA